MKPALAPATQGPTEFTGVALAAATLAALYAIPGASFLLLPVSYLNTLLHEGMHAAAGIATGAPVGPILVRADGSGETMIVGANPWLAAPAGYVGSTLLGLLMVLGASSERGARRTLGAVGIALAVGSLLFLRGEAAGIASSAFWIGTLLFSAYRSRRGAAFFARTLGLAQVAQSFAALAVLRSVSLSPDHGSDAAALARASGISAIVWALLWTLAAIAATGYALFAIWRRRRPRDQAATR